MSAPAAPKARTQFAVLDRGSGKIQYVIPPHITDPTEAAGHVIFPRSERLALVRIVEITAREQTPPSQITTPEAIREHVVYVQQHCADGMFPKQYEEAVRDTLLWVLNGGEPPINRHEHRCRLCGCTQENASWCIGRTGKPCHWVEDDLCSACADEQGEGELAPPEATLPREAL